MNAHLQMILSMLIFSTIGIFRRYLPLPSGFVAMMRGVIGMLFLLGVLKLRKNKLHWPLIRQKLPLMCLSGACLGINWILLFEAYNYTSVATATLCYYLAPMFIILLSPLVLRERLTLKKLACVCVSLLGMVFVSGVLDAGMSGIQEFKGVLLGLAAAVFYACVVLTNKKTTIVPGNDRTVVQLCVSSLVLLPYVLFTEEVTAAQFTPVVVVMMLVVGVVHTGLAYALYFSALSRVQAQTAAILSYIDPVGAILLSALLLKERMGLLSVIGAVLVLGAAIVSELPDRGEKRHG